MIKLKVVSTSGHDTFTMDPAKALKQIRTLANENGKWLFVDGVHRAPESITVDELNAATDITMANALAGG